MSSNVKQEHRICQPLIALAIVTGLTTAVAADQVTKNPDKEVTVAGESEASSHDQVAAEDVTIAGGYWRILSTKLTPPDDAWFKKTAGKWADFSPPAIDAFPNGGPGGAVMPGSNKTSVSFFTTVTAAAATADSFPIWGEGNLTPRGGGKEGQPGTPPTWHWGVKVGNREVDLDIAHGQGGAYLSEELEDTVGAFTVANLNDTDGDGTVDKDDNQVTKTGNNRDEVDLMALRVAKPYPLVGGANDHVTLTLKSGSAKLWESSTKGTEVQLQNGSTDVPVSELPVVYYVEATAASGSVRDIEIELTYANVSDTVRATGIWAEFVAAAHSTTDAEDLFATDAWKDTPENPKGKVEAVGGTGLRPYSPQIGARNVILIKFVVRPAGLTNEPRVAFDVTRQKHARTWKRAGDQGPFTQMEYYAFPAEDEKPNDDTDDSDESETLDDTSHFYVMDSPGRNQAIPGDPTWFAFQMNANEFMRVSFSTGIATRPSGDDREGSRCSSKFQWHVQHYWHRNTTQDPWERSDQGDNEIDDNPGHIEIDTQP